MRCISTKLLTTAMAVTVLLVAAPPAFAMQIFIKPGSAPTIALDVEATDTVDHVKAEIQTLMGVAPSNQELVFQGQILEDGRTLADYNIQKEATIQLVLGQDIVSSSAASPWSVCLAAIGALGVAVFMQTQLGQSR